MPRASLPNSHRDDFFAHVCYNKSTVRAEFI